LVTHNHINLKRVCESGIILEKGIMHFLGKINDCVDFYSLRADSQPAKSSYERDQSLTANHRLDYNGKSPFLYFSVSLKFKEPVTPRVLVKLFTLDNFEICGFSSSGSISKKSVREAILELIICCDLLMSGLYLYEIYAFNEENETLLGMLHGKAPIKIETVSPQPVGRGSSGVVNFNHTWRSALDESRTD
jgi:hypothetical protein